ncbi:NupC/NupG family nucleoside CNT transporter [Haloechinothrix halophila]|uniref:NupC/NupG family nucleoside CNT transporter n=1 Tax=Haloechinothrix halophila TaxID=1069073 RepID=UPI000409282D|nr:NupC/NupG family nucleoside CNT transporter [Haloechinothrix halophila]
MFALLAVAFALSSHRRAINPRTVLGALAIQFGFGVLVLYWDVGQRVLAAASNVVKAVIATTDEGIGFLFGPILPDNGMVFAFQVLPIVVFVAALSAVLYHLRILQWVVRVIGGALRLVLGTSRAESLAASTNVFLGQTESPLIVRPYLSRMTRSEFFAVMVCGLSTVAGTVLVGYSMLGARLDYLMAAAFMAAPGGLLMAKIIIPETEHERVESGVAPAAEVMTARTAGTSSPPWGTDAPGAAKADVLAGEHAETSEDTSDSRNRNVIDAAANGAADGLKLALNIGAMLLAFISLIALLNLIVGGVGGLFGMPELSIQQILGYVFAPVMFLIGVPWEEAIGSGGYLGQKLILNEFVAFAEFGPHAAEYSDRTATITTFALTGFANLGSLAILLGGLGSLVPQRRPEIAQLGLRAILAGTLANLMSAAIAGILIG